jgi:hypothetical protein
VNVIVESGKVSADAENDFFKETLVCNRKRQKRVGTEEMIERRVPLKTVPQNSDSEISHAEHKFTRLCGGSVDRESVLPTALFLC